MRRGGRCANCEFRSNDLAARTRGARDSSGHGLHHLPAHAFWAAVWKSRVHRVVGDVIRLAALERLLFRRVGRAVRSSLPPQPTSRRSLSFRPENPEYPYQASLAQNFRDGLWLRASVSRWASRGSRATRSLKVSLVMGDSTGGSELMVEPTRSRPGRSMSVAVVVHRTGTKKHQEPPPRDGSMYCSYACAIHSSLLFRGLDFEFQLPCGDVAQNGAGGERAR